ncbi:MAG: hypothetical protein WC521_02950 [Bdellovibrionales bacterium]
MPQVEKQFNTTESYVLLGIIFSDAYKLPIRPNGIRVEHNRPSSEAIDPWTVYLPGMPEVPSEVAISIIKNWMAKETNPEVLFLKNPRTNHFSGLEISCNSKDVLRDIERKINGALSKKPKTRHRYNTGLRA